MGKKNKHKKKSSIDWSKPFSEIFEEFWNLDFKDCKLTSSGEIKVKKKEKINIGSFVENSFNNSRMSRL